MRTKATVIICSHNPRRNVLQRTIEALRAQVLTIASWDLVVVDNNSDQPIRDWLDLSWHPSARVVEEKRPGLTPARLCGIRASVAPLLVFVDDDNLLAPDYLTTAVTIADDCPFLGAWGGSCRGEFETPPPPWAASRLDFVAVREITRETWSNEFLRPQATPIGAGMCVRRTVAETYANAVEADSAKMDLDRQGNSLMGCGDIDMAYTAIDLGLGIGTFPQLSLVHVIPPSRFDESYFLRLVEGSQASSVILRARRGLGFKHPHGNSKLMRLAGWIRALPKHPMERRFLASLDRGYRKGLEIVRSLGLSAT